MRPASPLIFSLAIALAAFPVPPHAAPPTVAPPAGLRENTPAVHALVGARIVVAPGKAIEQGTVVLRDGLIAAVGPDVQPPSDARVWDVRGKTLYPGLVDAYSEIEVAPGREASGYWNSKVTPHLRADQALALDRDANKRLRGQGITLRLVAPAAGIVKGTSTLATTGDDPPSQAVLREQAALHIDLPNLMPHYDKHGGYPTSPMGAVALVRQVFYDADWYRQAWAAYEREQGLPRPEQSAALAALEGYLSRSGIRENSAAQRDTGGILTNSATKPVVINARNELYFFRADQIGREFGLNVVVRGSGREYRRPEAIAATGRGVIVPLNFPATPNVTTPEAAMSVPLEDLLHADLAPENPARLAEAGVRFAFTSFGLKDQTKFLARVRQAVQRGLKPDDALRALCVTPAEMFGVADRVGTLEAGKAAHLLVVEGDLLDKESRLLETWVDGKRYEVAAAPMFDLRGTWEVKLQGGADRENEIVVIELGGEPAKLTGTLKRGEREAKLESAALGAGQFACTFKGKEVGWEGIVQLSATVTHDAAKGDAWLGNVSWADGSRTACSARRTEAFDPKKVKEKEADKSAGGNDKQNEPGNDNVEEPNQPRRALFAVNYPLGAFGRETPLPPRPKSVLFKNATVWTCGPQGKLEQASVLVEEGRIKAVGHDLAAGQETIVIDATGKHVAPGIVDCHSHIATDGGLNETGQTNTAEVRIGDFIDNTDIDIYRALAGGVTCVNVLHGSDNTIGGQNQVIKLRWGALPEEMKLAGAPPGIKFALGENVKQSNWGDEFINRYPQTRMGVEQLILDAFAAARQYQRTWEAWGRAPQGIPPRKDLELEALAEVLAGRRWIHCHSYRQDEILAFLRTCSLFGVRVATLQHVLEGYKVADTIAREGVGGSSFADWWAYKFEVYDGIPYNGTLMHNAGVLVSFNSDDPELGRRLNTEAAKAVKYGGLQETEALKFVTLNPAKQLRIDDRLGSLEQGKDADLVVWSGPPLSAMSRVEQTWIDGRKYFDRDEDRRQNERAEKMRAALVQRFLSEPKEAEEKEEAAAADTGEESDDDDD